MPGKKNMIIILGILLSTFGLAYFAINFFSMTSPEEKKENKQKALYRMPTQIVNLSGTNGTRYLKIELVLEYEYSSLEKAQKNFEDQKTVLIDSLIMWVSNKTISNIDGFENKEILKEEIRQKFQKILADSLKITNIYYQTFLVQ